MTPRGARYSGVLLYAEAVDFTRQVERYLQVFDRRQVHVVLMDDMVSDPVPLWTKCSDSWKSGEIRGLALLHGTRIARLAASGFTNSSEHRTSWVFESRVSCAVPAGPCSDMRSAFGWLDKPSATSIR